MSNDDVEALARDLCFCAGDSPDVMVLYANWAFEHTAQGHILVPDMSRSAVPNWSTYAVQARMLLALGWTKATQE